MSSLSSTVATANTVQRIVRERDITYLSAALSYYMLVSLLPLLVLTLVVTATLNRAAVADLIERLLGTYLLPTGQSLVLDALTNGSSGGVTLVSLVLAVWGTLKVFRGLDRSFARIYESESGGFLDSVRDALAALTAVGLGLVSVAGLSIAVGIVDLPYLAFYAPAVLVLSLFLAFLPLYYVLPDVDLSVRDVVPGALFSAVGWSALSVGFSIYTTVASRDATTALGSLVLLVTWFYFAGTLLLVGAVVNYVLAGGGTDRKGQHPSDRQFTSPDMSEDRDDGAAGGEERDVDPRGAADISQLEDRIEELRADLDAFEEDVRDRTVEKPTLEAELKQYVRSRMRRGHARGWGPYLVLLYGVVLALGAFRFLDGGWAILAMVVTFLSTLGLYVVFLLVGFGLNLLSVPGKAADVVRERRE
ncbi:MAG: YhjD/YihY/BrkB family envelope integrity protein [Haloferacaceae archaeon]